jgi:hypothetical protein
MTIVDLLGNGDLFWGRSEDPRSAEIELRESLETADEHDREERATESQLGFGAPACQNMSLRAEELRYQKY